MPHCTPSGYATGTQKTSLFAKKVEDHQRPDLGYKSSLYFLFQKEFQSELG